MSLGKILLISLLAFLWVADETTFIYEVKGSDEIWFTELIGEMISVIIEVSTQSTLLGLKVKHPAGSVLYDRQFQTMMKYPFTSYDAGEYTIWITNTGVQVADFGFSIKTGIDAKDYTELISKKHLEPIELEAKMLEETIAELHDKTLEFSKIDLFYFLFEAIFDKSWF